MRRATLLLLAVALTVAAVAVMLRPAPDAARPPLAPESGGLAREAPGTAPAGTIAPTPPIRPSAEASALERAREMLATIQARGGEPLAGYVGGRAFQNRERRLPPGRYREYDVHPRVAGRDRGPERLIIEQATGRAYYTGDHYRTFVSLN
jgi:ribonuclease T1